MSDLGTFKTLAPIAFESVSNVTTTPSVALGTRRIYNGEEYVYFCNGMVSAATAGIAMVVSLSSSYTLTRSSTSEADFVVCFVKHADVAASSYAWGLVRGEVQAWCGSTMSTGVMATIGLNGVLATGCVTTTLSFVGPTIGKTVSAATANGQALTWVKCFG